MNTVQIVAASNNLYVPFLSVMLQSVMDFSSPERNYSVTVLHTDIEKQNRKTLFQMMRNNFRMEFINVSKRMQNYTSLFVSNHIKIETYFRLLLPELMPETEKVLYIDCDVIANQDVAELYDINTDGYLLAAARDADSAANYNTHREDKDYIDNVLKLKNPYDYLQAGVIVMNLKKFRSECNTERLLNVALSRQWKFHDQDTLNYLCQGKILFVDYAWNFVYDYNESVRRSVVYLSNAPADILTAYLEAKKNPKMIHFSWTDKPWFSPGIHFGEKWWMTARRTPYYSQMLVRMEEALARYILWTQE